MSLIGIMILSLSILGAELGLVWNSVSGVYEISSVGQLIPFVAGLGSLVQTLCKITPNILIKALEMLPHGNPLRRSIINNLGPINAEDIVEPQSCRDVSETKRSVCLQSLGERRI